MKRQMIMRRLVAIFMIAGLILAPLSQPVAAESLVAGAMAAMSRNVVAAATMDEMANDMPCCPSKALSPIDCEKCLLMAVCMATGFMAVMASALLHYPAVSSQIARPKDDSWLHSLAHPPLDHPPRILI